MPSNIDATVPVAGSPTTASVRNNFLTAKNEITALQAATAITIPVSIANGGTGATTAPIALSNLQAVPIAGATMSGPLILSGSPTQPLGAADKAYVDAYFPVSVANGGTGATTTNAALANLGAAPLASPAFTGTPTAPTTPSTDSTANIATTSFVHAAISASFGALTANRLIVGTGTGAAASAISTDNGSNLAVSLNTAGSLPAAPVGTMLRLASADGANTVELMESFGTGNASYRISRGSRGTGAAPTASQLNDVLGGLQYFGRGATSYATNPSGSIFTTANENFTDSAQGGNLQFSTITTGSTTLVNRMQLRQGLLIGNPSPDLGQGSLVVNENAAMLPAPPAGTQVQIAAADNQSPFQTIDCFGTPGSITPQTIFRRARGTGVSQSAVQSGDRIGTLSMRGYGATAYSGDRVALIGTAAENWTDTAQGTQWQVQTTATGTTTPTQRVTVNQGVVIGNSSADPGQGGLTLNANAAALPAGPVGGRTVISQMGGADNAQPTLLIDAFSTTNAPPELFLRSAHGTGAAPAATASGDYLGLIEFGGRSTGGYPSSAPASVQFLAQALENFSDTARGASLAFSTAAAGTIAAVSRMTVRQGVVIGNSSADPGQGGLTLNANAAVLPAGGILNIAAVDGGDSDVNLRAYGATPRFRFNQAAGTGASPTGSPNGNALGSLEYYGYNGTTYALGAQIWALVNQTWSGSGQGTSLIFTTTPTGATAAAQAMTLDGSGNLTVTGNAHVNTNYIYLAGGGGSVNAAGGPFFFADPNTMVLHGAGTGNIIFQNASGGQTFQTDASGNLTIQGGTATKPGGGSWVAPSDRALKSSVSEWNTGLAEVLRLRPISYQYNNDSWNHEHCDHIGLDAEDGAAIIPEMGRTVTLPVGPVPAEGESPEAVEAAALDHGPLLFALVNAVKELSARLDKISPPAASTVPAASSTQPSPTSGPATPAGSAPGAASRPAAPRPTTPAARPVRRT